MQCMSAECVDALCGGILLVDTLLMLMLWEGSQQYKVFKESLWEEKEASVVEAPLDLLPTD